MKCRLKNSFTQKINKMKNRNNNLILVLLLLSSISLSAQIVCDSFKTIHVADPPVYTPPESDPALNPDLISGPDDPIGQYKSIYWIHGMIGQTESQSDPNLGRSSWVNAASYVDNNYYTKSYRANYGSYQTNWENSYGALRSQIDGSWESPYLDYVNVVKPPMKDQVTLHDKGFAIAHSFGSVNIRAATTGEKLDAINGVVTYTGCHGGSPLSALVAPAYTGVETDEWLDFKNTVGKFAADIGGPPVAEKAQSIFILRLAESIGVLNTQEVISGVLNNAGQAVASTIVKKLAPPSVQVLDPDNIDALGLDEQLGDSSEGRRVAIGANIVSDPDAHNTAVQMFYSGLHSVNNSPAFQAQEQKQIALDILERNTETYFYRYLLFRELIDMAADDWCPFYKKDICYDQSVEYDPDNSDWQSSVSLCDLSCADGMTPLSPSKAYELKDAYINGYLSFRRLNDWWETLCGARSVQIAEGSLGTCICATVDYTENMSEEDCGCEWEPYSYETTLLPYDGFIPINSQVGWVHSDGVFTHTVEGSNHLTVRNDGNTLASLGKLLDGKFGKFFRTNKK